MKRINKKDNEIELIKEIERLNKKIDYLEELDRKNFLQLLTLQNKVFDYENNYMKLSKNDEVVSLVIKNKEVIK